MPGIVDYHLIVQTRPDAMRQASDEEIARRWCRLFVQKGVSEELRISDLIQDKSFECANLKFSSRFGFELN